MITLKHFIFNELEVNAFVLNDDSGACLIVDPGCKNPVQQQNLKKYITGNNLRPEYIVLTHGHYLEIGFADRNHQPASRFQLFE